jgi:hypothetical protein
MFFRNSKSFTQGISGTFWKVRNIHNLLLSSAVRDFSDVESSLMSQVTISYFGFHAILIASDDFHDQFFPNMQ